jgi:uncharacterized membrane protein (DUF485 family)
MLTPDQIRHMPEYQELTQARKKILIPLSIATIVAYFSLILAIGFYPHSLGTSLTGGTTSIGVTLGLGLILFCFVITGIYVTYANRVLEPLIKKIQAKARGDV